MFDKILQASLDKVPEEILYGLGFAALVLGIALTFFAKPKAESIASILNVPITNVSGICVDERGLIECMSFSTPRKGTLSVTESKFEGTQTYIKFKLSE